MSLRRFPWKQPRLTDNSYKLFASPPSQGTPSTDAEIRDISRPRPRSAIDVVSLAPDRPSNSADPSKDKDNASERASSQTRASHSRNSSSYSEDKRYPRSEPATREGRADRSQTKHSYVSSQHEQQRSATPTGQGQGQSGGQRQDVLKGPWRLVRLLPRESRYIIARMLKIDPRARASLEEVTGDYWLRTTAVCQQTESNEVISAPGHTHILEPPANVSAPQPNKKKT